MRCDCSLCFVVLIFLGSASAAPINVTLDWALVLGIAYIDQFDKMIPALKLVPTSFTIGPTFTRIALVMRTSATEWRVFTSGLTDDRTAYAVYTRMMRHVHNLIDFGPPLKRVREEVFVGSDSARTKVVWIIVNHEKVSDEAEKEAKLLRDSGVSLFVLSENGDKKDLMKLTNDEKKIDLLTGDAEIAGAIQRKIVEVAENITGLLCEYNESCFYANSTRQKCAQDWWSPRTPTPLYDCNKKYPPPASSGKTCQTSECEKMCEKWWPEDASACDHTTCGKEVVIKTVDTMLWRNLQHCARTKICPPCATTTTTSTSSSFGTSDTTATIVIVGLVVVLVLVVATAVGVVLCMIVKRRHGALKSGKGPKAADTPSKRRPNAKSAKKGLDAKSAKKGLDAKSAKNGSGLAAEEGAARGSAMGKGKSIQVTSEKKSKMGLKK